MERKKTTNTKKSWKNMTKEQMQEALQRKKEGNARALEIVEYFIDNVPTVDEFLGKLFDINQSHYQDAVEERAILNKCGYVLCSNMLGSIPKKQYHISTLQNRVFDITERKNFCSNNCFKCSNYIKDQMLTSPLWMRDTEKCPDFKLLSRVVRSCKDFTGNEIDLGRKRVKPSEIEKPEENKDITTLEELMSDVDQAIHLNEMLRESAKNMESQNSNTDNMNNADSDSVNDAESNDRSSESVKINAVDISSHKTPEKSVEITNDTKQESTETIKSPDKCDTATTLKNEDRDVIAAKPRPKIGVKINLVKEIVEIEAPKQIIDKTTLESTSLVCTDSPNKQNEKANPDTSIPKSVEKSKPTQCDNSNKDKDVPSKLKSKQSNSSSKEQDALSKARHNILILETSMKQWISVDTLILLLGETAVQNVLLEANKHYKKHAETMRQLGCQSESNINQLLGSNKQAYAKYATLCKKLNMMELAEEAEDSQLMGRSSKPEKPVPNYDELKKQTEEMMIKVNEFYRGEFKVKV
uniref:RNA polymerase II subunit B1 CTD phosphatase RPAP2 homolog n=1 Tax=Cacopsylla melanoneura TaxID=428564 RepID=A0A8D8Q7C9_9HEMI